MTPLATGITLASWRRAAAGREPIDTQCTVLRLRTSKRDAVKLTKD